MNKKLPEIEAYWNLRARGYSMSVVDELQSSVICNSWLSKIERHVKLKKGMKVLDVGCGCGFFTVLLSRKGLEVTGIDYTEGMLAKANENLQKEGLTAELLKMDAQSIDFPDNVFDLVITRNLMWNLEQPDKAYQEWMRVLKEEGTLLNFDGNYYLQLFDEDYKKGYEDIRYAPEKYGHDQYNVDNVDFSVMEKIAYDLPLSRVHRPKWDLETLMEAGAESVTARLNKERSFFIEREDGSNVRMANTFLVAAVK